MTQQQCADAVLMIRPAAFDYNPETAASNRMQQPSADPGVASQERALAEFDACALTLRSEGIRVCVVEDTPEPRKPDALFPNNWVSFHRDGTVVLYPMQAPSRRLERRLEIIGHVADELGFRVRRVLDLTLHESADRFLEGTGSLVLDHVGRLAYACRSPRTHPEVAEEWARALGYELLLFDASDRHGVPLYHTNVMLSIGTRSAVVAREAIAPRDRDAVIDRLRASGREIIEIDHHGVAGFAGNLLELASWDEALGDLSVIVMSASARDALGANAFARLSACADSVLAVPLPTIERLGGGSVRCMLAEVFVDAEGAA
jgi:hypothetical protein